MVNFHPKAQMKPIIFEKAIEGVRHQVGPAITGQALRIARVMPPGACNGSGKFSRQVLGRKVCYLTRLHYKKVAPTLTKSPRAHILLDSNCCPSLAQAKRIASFPDAFCFVGSWDQGWERIGNSVPPRFMEAIASHVYATFLCPSDTKEQPNMPLDFIDKPINPSGPYKFTVITTFAGCGGSSLGYKWARGKILAAVEWDDNAVATYRLNHHGTPVIHRDIAKVTVEELLDLTGLRPGELDIFDGSPPCQGFSTAGKRQLDDPRNSLFKEYVRLLRGLQPKVFVMENVSGMVKGHMKHVFAIVMRELKASGYQVKCQLMNAKYFGVPQSRERVIFIGVRNDLNIEPSHLLAQTKVTGIESAPKTRTQEQRYTEHEIAMSIAHRKRHEAKGNGFGFTVLQPGKPSCTFPKTLIKFTSPRFVEGKEHWLPSTIEMNRIASFPDRFQFAGSYKDQWARIGNSVPPRFMEAIASHIYTNILSKIPEHAEETSHAQ